MKARVVISSFRRGENQGTCSVWGMKTLEVHIENMPVIGRNGCISGEITRDVPVRWVELEGRQFCVEKFENTFGSMTEYEKKGAQYEVTVPYEVADRTLRPKNCECDNTHEKAGTCCRPCWEHGFRQVPQD